MPNKKKIINIKMNKRRMTMKLMVNRLTQALLIIQSNIIIALAFKQTIIQVENRHRIQFLQKCNKSKINKHLLLMTATSVFLVIVIKPLTS